MEMILDIASSVGYTVGLTEKIYTVSKNVTRWLFDRQPVIWAVKTKNRSRPRPGEWH